MHLGCSPMLGENLEPLSVYLRGGLMFWQGFMLGLLAGVTVVTLMFTIFYVRRV